MVWFAETWNTSEVRSAWPCLTKSLPSATLLLQDSGPASAALPPAVRHGQLCRSRHQQAFQHFLAFAVVSAIGGTWAHARNWADDLSQGRLHRFMNRPADCVRFSPCSLAQAGRGLLTLCPIDAPWRPEHLDSPCQAQPRSEGGVWSATQLKASSCSRCAACPGGSATFKLTDVLSTFLRPEPVPLSNLFWSTCSSGWLEANRILPFVSFAPSRFNHVAVYASSLRGTCSQGFGPFSKTHPPTLSFSRYTSEGLAPRNACSMSLESCQILRCGSTLLSGSLFLSASPHAVFAAQEKHTVFSHAFFANRFCFYMRSSSCSPFASHTRGNLRTV